uniref:Uncharacterized protein n=1 Tax=Cacopsylla melanoneura TaxID=428564 RepID=A0A8D9B7S7_9HEMI
METFRFSKPSYKTVMPTKRYYCVTREPISITEPTKMANNTGLLVLLLAGFFKNCQSMSMSVSNQVTHDRFTDMQAKLMDPQISPVLTEAISTLKTIIETPTAKYAMETVLDNVLVIASDSNVMDTLDYAMTSLALALSNTDFQNILKKCNMRSTQALHDNDVKHLFRHGVNTLYILLTDQAILKMVQYVVMTTERVLTDPQSQGTLTELLLAANRIVGDREALAYIQQTVRGIDDILSSKIARQTITKAVDTMETMIPELDANNAKRLGKLMPTSYMKK